MRHAHIAFMIALLAAPLAAAQPNPPPEQELDIVVTARQHDAIENFVGALSVGAGHRALGRWDNSICPGILGMNAPHAQFMIDRIAVRAMALGLTVGESGCRPNVLIFMSRDANGIAEQIANHPRLRSPGGRHGNTRGRDALREFAHTPRAVRWWHVSNTVSEDGFVVARGAVIQVREMGRTQTNVRQDFSRVVIVIDANLIDGVRLDTLSDYVAMAALAQLDPEADTTGVPTILSVFAPNRPVDAPAALTSWDEAYLEGLYSVDRTARNQAQQEADIAQSMMQERPPSP